MVFLKSVACLPARRLASYPDTKTSLAFEKTMLSWTTHPLPISLFHVRQLDVPLQTTLSSGSRMASFIGSSSRFLSDQDKSPPCSIPPTMMVGGSFLPLASSWISLGPASRTKDHPHIHTTHIRSICLESTQVVAGGGGPRPRERRLP